MSILSIASDMIGIRRQWEPARTTAGLPLSCRLGGPTCQQNCSFTLCWQKNNRAARWTRRRQQGKRKTCASMWKEQQHRRARALGKRNTKFPTRCLLPPHWDIVQGEREETYVATAASIETNNSCRDAGIDTVDGAGMAHAH